MSADTLIYGRVCVASDYVVWIHCVSPPKTHLVQQSISTRLADFLQLYSISDLLSTYRRAATFGIYRMFFVCGGCVSRWVGNAARRTFSIFHTGDDDDDDRFRECTRAPCAIVEILIKTPYLRNYTRSAGIWWMVPFFRSARCVCHHMARSFDGREIPLNSSLEQMSHHAQCYSS